MIRVPLDTAISLMLLAAFVAVIGGSCLLASLIVRPAPGVPAMAAGAAPPSPGPLPSGAPDEADSGRVAGLVATDADGRIVDTDQMARRMLGRSAHGELLADFLPDLAGADGTLRLHVHEGRLLGPDGGAGHVDLMVVPRPHSGWLVAIRDAGPRHQRLNRLEQMALHDPLTGLPNRVLFADRAEQAMALAERRGESCAILMLDLDRFKQVNDTLGHDIGDLLLRAVAPRLAEPLRRTDTLARLGGDEFAVLLPPPTSADEAVEVARRLVQAMHPQFLIEGFSLGLGVSIGIALRPRHGNELDALLRSADEAMYAAKRDVLGYVLAGQPQDLGVIRRPALRTDLERAIEAEGELTIHFQPKIEAASRSVAGFEGLLRWDHPIYGRLHPDMFLPVAERARLMGPLTRFVLDECLKRQREWRAHGYRLEVAVNLANFWLRDDQLIDHVHQALTSWGAAPAELTLDVTEGSIMADPERSRLQLQRLRELGCRVAMDDFGTGYSSLTHLQRLPLDEIKVHRSFVAPLEEADGPARVVLRSIVGIAHGLGLVTTAEGVESEQVARSVAELGCERLQGYLIAAPMGAEEALAWLQRWAPGVTRAAA
ncbi:MAG TPA: EAL domain-containing protein [Geminicoccus sp.]|uniref:putative bifunctional diguanylate cyclase/phosphodiesterase n=1 Tax=Geminicoccus sp. TaxID=2024832 RepID=UPI002BF7791E|nr:EAL domain-containing protein [Geminicoccus sp.]HWL70046.1 EAL domain-containing protein [Geminicoccus sp.]